MTPSADGSAPQRTRSGAPPAALVLLGYAWSRVRAELRRPLLWLAAAFACLLAWGGSRLEILQFDDSPERSWGIALSTAETLAILLVLVSRVRGADVAGGEGWSDALRASSLGAPGLCLAETTAAAAAAWLGGGACALVLVFRMHMPPPIAHLASWGGALLVELALLAAWVAFAAASLGRLPGLGIAVAVVILGRLGVGGPAVALWPAPGPSPPEVASLAALAGSLATLLGITALTTAGRGATRTND